DVVAAGSMTEAMERVREHSRTVELIVCDVVMPGASGPEAVVKLIAEAPRAKVLLMSGYTDHALLDAEMVASAGFLQKPFAPDVFSQKVREVLAGEVA
ncbi:MAG TPA: response regulator, partial [Kofleriaceae bacterium]